MAPSTPPHDSGAHGGATLTRDVGTFGPPMRGGSRTRELLVYGDGSSFRVALPRVGRVVLGRGESATVDLGDRAASRAHAEITCDVTGLRIQDLGSHNGTRLNGRPLVGGAKLLRGDTITIGATHVVVLTDGDDETRARTDLDGFRALVREHAARAAREAYVFAVIALEFDDPTHADLRALAPSLKPGEILGTDDGRSALVLVPLEDETIEARAAAIAEATVDARVGFASCPADASDEVTLTRTARAAAERATRGKVASGGETYVTRALGEGATVLLAEPSMVRAYDLLERLARGTLPVLVRGETGTGKELAASFVHRASARAKGPYVAVNCAAWADTLLESELFGHEKGAFTGAVNAKIGVFEAANGGTLFLDEIGELSREAQAKLLRVLELGVLTRVGGTREIKVDVRVVAATHRDLHAEADAGRFRKDLLFRIGTAAVVLPPLRERPREIPLLARTFVERSATTMGRSVPTLGALTLGKLARHAWDGNVRELKNVVDYAMAVLEGDVLEPWHLPPLGEAVPSAPAATASLPAVPVVPGRRPPLADEIRDLERTRIREALEISAGVQARAAEVLGMPVRTLFAKLRAHGIDPKSFVTDKVR